MDRLRRILRILIVLIVFIYGLELSYGFNPVWVIVMVSASITFGLLSSIVAARKLFFLAGASPHSALLAVALAVPLTYTFGGGIYLWSMIIGVLLVYIAGYSIHRGVDPDIATAVFISFTASSGVLVAYYVLTNYPLGFDLASIIIGDPILTTWYDALVAVSVAIVSSILILLTYREQLSLGIDRDSAYLAGIRVPLYDLVVFTLIGLTAITFIRIMGYVLEHVLVLLPASIAVSRARGSMEALEISILSALTASLLGLHLGVILNLSPTGLTGLILLTYYLAAIASRRIGVVGR